LKEVLPVFDILVRISLVALANNRSEDVIDLHMQAHARGSEDIWPMQTDQRTDQNFPLHDIAVLGQEVVLGGYPPAYFDWMVVARTVAT